MIKTSLIYHTEMLYLIHLSTFEHSTISFVTFLFAELVY